MREVGVVLVRSLVVASVVSGACAVVGVTSAACTRDYDALVETGSSGTSGTSGGKSSGGASSGTSGGACSCSACTGTTCDLACEDCQKCACSPVTCGDKGCNIRCRPGTACDVLCKPGASCTVRCDEGAFCTCSGTGCSIDCPVQKDTCKDGFACNAECR